MWIQTKRPGTRRFYDAELDVALTFTSNGTCQVAEDVGAQLCAKHAALEPYDGADGDDSDSDSDTDSDEAASDG